jgi:hypothetical protein
MHEHPGKLIGFKAKVSDVAGTRLETRYKLAYSRVTLIAAIRTLNDAIMAARSFAARAHAGGVKFTRSNKLVGAVLAAANLGGVLLFPVGGFTRRENASNTEGYLGYVSIQSFLKAIVPRVLPSAALLQEVRAGTLKLRHFNFLT